MSATNKKSFPKKQTRAKSVEEAMREAHALHERFTFSDPPEDEYGEDLQKRKFCLSCGATHYSEICPFCQSDAQDDL